MERDAASDLRQIEAIRYAITRRDIFVRFLTDGLSELDSNIVQRAIRPQTITRKNSLFAGSDGGGRTWATIATLLQTCKMNNADPRPGEPIRQRASQTNGPQHKSMISCHGIISPNGISLALIQSLVRVEVNGTTAGEVYRWSIGSRVRDVAADLQDNISVLEDNGNLLGLVQQN